MSYGLWAAGYRLYAGDWQPYTVDARTYLPPPSPNGA